ncbi:hypothetical protein ACFYSH_25740 [Streptomyces sp. NPDC005791]
MTVFAVRAVSAAAGAFTASVGSDLYRGGDVQANVAWLRASLDT